MTSQEIQAMLLQQPKIIRRPGLAADLVGGANFNIFNIGGMIKVTQIWGHVTIVIGAGAAVPQIVHTPGGGGGAVPICAAAATIAADAVDTIYVIVGGALGTQLTPGPALGAVDTAGTGWAGNVLLITDGIISIVNAVASTGIIDWYIAYAPASADSLVEAL